jgi:uncharacterized membrane protein YeaQ/YmgE (transglycosylase-associated protein family)
MGLFANIIMGIIGAVVGNFLFSLLGIQISGFLGNLLSATIAPSWSSPSTAPHLLRGLIRAFARAGSSA